MHFIDIHAHVQFAAYDKDRDEVMRRAREADVGMVNVGTQHDTSRAAVDLARAYPDIAWVAIGLHPIHTSKSFHDKNEFGEEGKAFTSRGERFDYDFYKGLARDSKVVAIGECGLDYYHLTPETRNAQRAAFDQQIKLAIEFDKPLMLHIRNGSGIGGGAYGDVYNILKSYKTARGNLHFFAGDWETAKKFLDLGFMLSFTGVITFSRQYDEIVKNIPLDMIMAETDAPYVSPEPFRGKRNEPANVRYVYEKIAEIKGLTLEQTQEAILKNAKRVFKI